jgi:Rap1a immunity proteins
VDDFRIKTDGRRARSRSDGTVATFLKALIVPAMIALALAAVSFSSRPAQAFETARELAAQCKGVDVSVLRSERDAHIPGTSAASQCWGYMQAMQDLLALVDDDGKRIMGVCPNEQTSLLQMTHTFVGYAERHSSDLSNDAALIVVQALKETFPCP